MTRRRARGPSASARVTVSLTCSTCQTRNYKTTKRSDKPLELKKFCKVCAAHTVHVASK